MKMYEKPIVEFVSFQAEEVMAADQFALNGHVGFSEVDANALPDQT